MKKPVIILAALCLVAGLTVGLCAALGVFGGSSEKPPAGSDSKNDNPGSGSGTNSPDTDPSSGGENMDYQKKNYADEFNNPSAKYRWHNIGHGFAADYGKETSKFLAGIKEMKNLGVGGIVTNVPWTDEYVTDPVGFEWLSKGAKALFNNGLNMWLYDEKGYPSGQAGGYTTKDHPEYLARGIVFEAKEGSGSNSVTVNCPDDVLKIHSAYAVNAAGEVVKAEYSDKKATFAGTDGKWTFYVFYEKVLFEGTHAANNGSGQAYYPNLMDKNAVSAFIDNTYKQYAEKFEYFNKIVGVFTDEPSLMEVYQNTPDTFKYSQLATVDGFEDKFEQMHGYSVADKYHLIFTGDSDEAKIVRVNYRETVAEILSKTYFGALREFCEANGSKSSGHCLLEESMNYHAHYYGNLMQCLREMSIPGVDGLAMKTENYLSEGWPIFMAVKYASSVATLTDKDRLVMMETCATDLPSAMAYNDEQYKQFRTTLNNIFFDGVTHINSYVATNLFADHAKELLTYLGRLSYMSRSAVWDGQVGVYYPIASIQAYTMPSYSAALNGNANGPQMGKIGMALYKSQQDFTVVDDIFIREAKAENGKLYTDNVSFSVMIMPTVEIIPLDVMQKLDAFEKSGGTVIWIDRTPDLADKTADRDAVKALASGKKTVGIDEAVAQSKKAVADKLAIDKTTSTLFVGRYMLEDAPMYWLVNNNSLEKVLNLSYEGAKGFDIYNPNTGKITSVSGSSAEVTVDASSAAFVVVKF